MKTQHTPGPLRYTPQKIESGADCCAELFDSEGKSVAMIALRENPDEANYTASLFASAPEMLDMLISISEAYNRDGHLLNVSPSKIKELIDKSTKI